MVKVADSKISHSSAASLIYFLTKGSVLGILTCNVFRVAKTSSYISAIIGSILSIIPLLLNIYILKNGKGDSIIDTIENLFGKVLGRIINVIISIFFIMFASILMYNFISFIDIELMPETSKIYVAGLLIILFSYMLSKGERSFCKASQIMFYIGITVLLFTLAGSLSASNVENLFPVMEGGVKGILKGAIIYTILSGLPIFLINLVGKSQVDDENKYVKSIVKYYIIASIVLICLFISALLTVGINIASINKYPEYLVLTQVKIFNIVERAQNIFSMQLCFNVIILCFMCMMYGLNTAKKIVKKRKILKLITYIIPTFVIILSLKIFKNITQANMFYIYKLPTIFGISMSIIILIICIFIFINKRKIEKYNKI